MQVMDSPDQRPHGRLRGRRRRWERPRRLVRRSLRPGPGTPGAVRWGTPNQHHVLALLGTPSTVSTFDDQKWYYIGQKSTQFAFHHPEILERSILVVSFDNTGYVSDKRIYSLDDGRDITPVARQTPTEGCDFSVMQQLLGNLGRLPGGQGTGSTPHLPGP